MAKKLNHDDDLHTIRIFWTKAKPAPFAGYFDSKADMFLAIALPGGFSGFGPTSDDAIRMARARAVISRNRALACNIDLDDWITGIRRRTTPALFALVAAYKKHDAKAADADDGVSFTSTPIDSHFPRHAAGHWSAATA